MGNISFLSETAEAALIEAVRKTLAQAQPPVDASLLSKDFWTNKELLGRGWSQKDINHYVSTGELSRIDAGGPVGFKYPTGDLISILKKYYAG
jgi:hypothetical protein